MLGPFQTWNFFQYECRTPIFVDESNKGTINTAVDSDVGCDGAEFNSVCCKYSQSLQIFFLSNMDKVFYN